MSQIPPGRRSVKKKLIRRFKLLILQAFSQSILIIPSKEEH